jgi:hypothetical protein
MEFVQQRVDISAVSRLEPLERANVISGVTAFGVGRLGSTYATSEVTAGCQRWTVLVRLGCVSRDQ